MMNGCKTASQHVINDPFANIYISDNLAKHLDKPLGKYVICNYQEDNIERGRRHIADYDFYNNKTASEYAGVIITNATQRQILKLNSNNIHIVADPWGNMLYFTKSKKNADRARCLGKKMQKYNFRDEYVRYPTDQRSIDQMDKGWSLQVLFYPCLVNVPLTELKESALLFKEKQIAIETEVPDDVVLKELQLHPGVPAASGLWAIFVLVPDVDIIVTPDLIRVIHNKTK